MKISKEIFRYIVFGVLTTLINIAIYNFLYYITETGNTASNIVAWVASVLFAFVTNRRWVFESKDENITKEAAEFFLCRAATGFLDLMIMFVTVDVMLFPAGLMKIASNVVVIALNYLASRLWIFNKRD